MNTLSSRDDDDDSEIGHWIGLTVQYDKRKNILILKYLDSYGRKYINKYIKIFFEKKKKKFNTKQYIIYHRLYRKTHSEENIKGLWALFSVFYN